MPGENLRIEQGTGSCPRCGQEFPLAALLAAAPVPKPVGSTIDSFRDANAAGFILPPLGRAKSGGTIFMAAMWNGISWVGLWVMVFSENGPLMVPLLIMMLFAAVGIYLLVWALYSLYGTTSLLVDRDKAVLEQKLFGRKRVRARPLAELESVGQQESYKENNRAVMGVALTFRSEGETIRMQQRFLFAAGRSPEEQDWIISELRQYLVSIGHPAWKPVA